MGRGEEEIDVRVPSRLLDEKEATEYLIRSNKNIGEWDFNLLANTFEEEDLLAWGFKEEELGKYFEDDSEEVNPVPDPPLIARAQVGAVYTLGKWVYCPKCHKKHSLN